MKNKTGFNQGLRGKLLASSVLAAMMAAVPMTGAQAQEVERVGQAAEEDDAVQQTIVVTGSRLNTNPNLTAASPVLSVDAAELDVRGTVRIEDLVNVLPQVFAGQAGEVSNGASGTANLDLRGLGPTRTLTLVDGRRLPFGSSTSSAVNTDLIPSQLVRRVDLLTGGASAVYGSDAVAGVVNFILVDDFEGFEVDIQGGFAQNGNGVEPFDSVLAAGGQEVPGGNVDGEELFVSGTLGMNSADGRGNVTLFGSYEIRNEISQADRSISACALGGDDGPQSFAGFGCVGSANFRLFGGPGGFGFQQATGDVTPFAGGPAETFNFGPFNFFQRPSERFQIYTRGHYDITENLQFFADLSYTNNSSDAQIAPTASFGIGAFSVNCDNPLIQGGGTLPLTEIFGCDAAAIAAGTVVDGITASHRNVEGGPRNSSLENAAFRAVAGFRGTFSEAFDYEVFAQFARTEDTSISTNDFIVANVQQAFLAVDDGMGNVVCQDPSGGCVPFNLFQRTADGQSLITQDQLDFVQGVGIVNGSTEQIVIGGNVQTDLGNFGISSPLSENGVGMLLGFEYRDDSLASVPDQISQIPGGGFTGVGGATLPVSGQVEVIEGFGEIQVPIITDQPFFQELTFSGQYRYSSYEVSGNGATNSFDTNTFGLQLSWQPIDDIKLRGQFQRAVRAPNVIELFTGQDTGLPNLNSAGTNANGVQLFDPCASDAPIASLAACMNTGVTAAQFGTILDVISGQTQSITGGNVNLTPESSDTFTIGAVLEPRFAPGLVLSIDYFDISVDDFINAGIPAQVTLDNCLATGDPTFCDLITRAPSGTLAAGTFGTGFLSTNLNIASESTSGIDFQAVYSYDLADAGFGDWGTLGINFAATWLNEFDFVPFPGGDPVQCSGQFSNSCPNPVNPEYRHRLLTTWDTPLGLQISSTWRFFGSTDNLSDTAPEIDATIGTEQYWDLAANYRINDHVGLRAGVLNVLGNQAPVSISSGPPLGNGNTFPTIFDTGRFVFLGATFTF